MLWMAPYKRRRAGEARAYAAAGWPVAPGAWWDPRCARYRCAQSDCITEGLHPTLPGIGGGIRRCQVSVVQASTRDLLFAAVADASEADLAAKLASAGALHHTHGSWVPLPPSQLASGPVGWIHSPCAARWRLPSLHEVSDVLGLAVSSASAAQAR
jgi:hypothetical protein